jgi:hypothetical protein
MKAGQRSVDGENEDKVLAPGAESQRDFGRASRTHPVAARLGESLLQFLGQGGEDCSIEGHGQAPQGKYTIGA